MTLRITDDFTITRSGSELVVEVFGAFPSRVRLTIDETKRAADAFEAAHTMMYCKQEAALPKVA